MHVRKWNCCCSTFHLTLSSLGSLVFQTCDAECLVCIAQQTVQYRFFNHISIQNILDSNEILNLSSTGIDMIPIQWANQSDLLFTENALTTLKVIERMLSRFAKWSNAKWFQSHLSINSWSIEIALRRWGVCVWSTAMRRWWCGCVCVQEKQILFSVLPFSRWFLEHCSCLSSDYLMLKQKP